MLHDVGEQGSADDDGSIAFLVMEHLDGQTLATRLEKGALALAEALTIAIEVASALDAAHRAGIVHRDLKPGNIMLTPSGAKLLDFGLAKTTRPAVGTNESMVPTTPVNITVRGTILGTFQYMAPEQIEGLEADSRTDVFAFGCVLFEMLAGKPPFEGKTDASLIGAILKDEPPAISTVRPVVPVSLTRMVATCLAKKPDDRWQSASDLRRELKWLADGHAPVESAALQPRVDVVVSRALPWVLAGVLGSALVAALLLWSPWRSTAAPDAPVTRLHIAPPDGHKFDRVTPPAVSPDGRTLVFAAVSDEGKSQLWMRPLASLTALPLADTDNGIYPFWSPDNKSIGFFANGKLKRIALSGGPAIALADAATGRGASWSPDGTIVFAPSIYDGLHQVAAAGGVVRPATRFEPGTPTQKFPCFLPDGRHFIYLFGAGGRDQQSIRIGSLDAIEESRPLLDGVDSAARYAQGHVLFVRGTTLLGRPFDARRQAFTGDEVPIAEHLLNHGVPLQSWVFSASENGVLAYQSEVTPTLRLMWRDRAGTPVAAVGDPGDLGGVRLSPDGRTAAVGVEDAMNGGSDIWLYDLARGLRSRLTSGQGYQGDPVWSPDGRVIVYASNRRGRYDLYRKAADGSRSEELLYADNLLKLPDSFSSDGGYLAYEVTSDPKTGGDIWILPDPLGPIGTTKPYPVMRTAFDEKSPRFSPDGRWIAYASNESRRFDVYVAPFPGPGGKRQVSTAGGTQPRWRSDGRELFYRGADNALMAATVAVNAKNGAFDVNRIERLFGPVLGSYDVSADGRRFLTRTSAKDDADPSLTIVQNWAAPAGSAK
jgi:Tol biopolymer transport system component